MDNIWNEAEVNRLTDVLSRLIQINTSNNNETEACLYIKKLFDTAGIKNEIIESAPKRGSIIARINSECSQKQPPVYIISHLDVVGADETKWSFPPFSGEISEGKLLGRGTIDTKQLTASGIAAMLIIKEKNLNLNRDIIFIATADEEQGSTYGMKFLTESRPKLFEPGYVFNEGGGFVLTAGDKSFRTICCGEKGVFEVKVRLQGDNTFADFLQITRRVSAFKLESRLCKVTERFISIAGEYIEKDTTLKNLYEYSINNTLTIGCFDIKRDESPIELTLTYRLVPGITKQEATQTIEEILAGINCSYEQVKYFPPFESDIDSAFLDIIRKQTAAMEKEDITLLPMLALGNTDGRFIRTNIYGYTPFLSDLPFSEVLKKVHLTDEFITIPSLRFCAGVIINSIIELGRVTL